MITNSTNTAPDPYKRTRRNDLVEPALSYRIVGVLFQVSNMLGAGLKEQYYQKALEVAFAEQNIPFRAQVHIPITFFNESIGRYYVDFIIEDKVVLEIKRGQRINRNHANQILGYLKTLQLPLGILAYFGNDGVTYKRFINT